LSALWGLFEIAMRDLVARRVRQRHEMWQRRRVAVRGALRVAMDDPLRRTMVVAPRGSTPSAMIETTGLGRRMMIVVYGITRLTMCRTGTAAFEDRYGCSCGGYVRWYA
jgi:hypothetical protein